MRPLVSRRRFLLSGATAIALSSSAQVARSAATTKIQRKDIRDLTADELDKYNEALRRLKTIGPQRPTWSGTMRTMPVVSDLDKKGYAFQASLHTSDCPHGNWWFLPWHRVYLFYFEKLLRNIVSDYKPSVPLAIPYWDWTTQRSIPGSFVTNSPPNPLFDDRRFVQALADADVGNATILRTVDLANSFEAFGSLASCAKRGVTRTSVSQFEAGPHGMVHVKVGWYDSDVSTTWPFGRPGTFRDPPTAAYDPIFWSHHANIDRLWDYWLTIAGHRNPSFTERCPSGAVTWGGLRFTEFVDVGGVTLDRSVEEFLTDPAIQSVEYLDRAGTPLTNTRPRFETMKPDDVSAVDGRHIADARPILQIGTAITFSIPINEDVKPHLRRTLAADATARPLLFEVQGVEIPASAPPVLVRAFLNKPDATADTSTDDPHYIGYFTFFDSGHAHAEPDANHKAGGQGFLLNLTPTIQKLDKQLSLEKPFTVSLVLVPLSEKASASLQQLQLPVGTSRLLLSTQP